MLMMTRKKGEKVVVHEKGEIIGWLIMVFVIEDDPRPMIRMKWVAKHGTPAMANLSLETRWTPISGLVVRLFNADRGQASIGVYAPEIVGIDREEIYRSKYGVEVDAEEESN